MPNNDSKNDCAFPNGLDLFKYRVPNRMTTVIGIATDLNLES